MSDSNLDVFLCMVVVAFAAILYRTHVGMAGAVVIAALLCLMADRYLPERPAPTNPTDEQLNDIRQQITELKSDVSRASLAVGLRVRE